MQAAICVIGRCPLSSAFRPELIQIKADVSPTRYNAPVMTRLTRNIVRIDEEKCDGCGQCVPDCVEGALRIVNGKAKLIAEKLCDGMGACLGSCPRGAITIEQRPADEFDQTALQQHMAAAQSATAAPAAHPRPSPHHHHASGMCPGSRLRVLNPQPPRPAAASAASGETPAARPSQLGHWPVQLALLPPSGRMWQAADVLIAADCVPFAFPEFHEKLLAGKTLAIACPKLDDVEPYVRKLAMIFAANDIRSITVAHMEVPCCHGVLRVVQQALALAGRTDIPLNDVTIGTDGSTL